VLVNVFRSLLNDFVPQSVTTVYGTVLIVGHLLRTFQLWLTNATLPAIQPLVNQHQYFHSELNDEGRETLDIIIHTYIIIYVTHKMQ
jgi:hypothetical protein